MTSKETKEKVARHYDEKVGQLSDDMLAAKEKLMKPLYAKILEFAEVNRESTVGIIGSSTGAFPLFIAPGVKMVMGVDLSQESLNFAEKRTKQLGVQNVSCQKGDAESLPFEDNSIDVVLSDCVINLVPDKKMAFGEIHRVLKEDGVLVVADPVKRQPLTEVTDELLVSCIAGALSEEDYCEMLKEAGFSEIEIVDITELAKTVFTAHVEKFDRYSLNYVLIKARK